jgi:hypothetical protein
VKLSPMEDQVMGSNLLFPLGVRPCNQGLLLMNYVIRINVSLFFC